MHLTQNVQKVDDFADIPIVIRQNKPDNDKARAESEPFEEEICNSAEAATSTRSPTMDVGCYIVPEVFKENNASKFQTFPHTSNTTSSNERNILNEDGKLIAKYTSTLSVSLLSIDSITSNDIELILAMQSAAKSQNINYYIPGTSLQKIEHLGRGQFGDVWQYSMECVGQNGEIIEIIVAAKILIDANNRIDFLREALNMQKLQHNFIVKMIGISKVSAI